MKKGYLVSTQGDEYCVAVVAESSKEAKKLGWAYQSREGWDWEYTELRVKWKRNVDVSTLDIGAVESTYEGLKAGLYDWIEDFDLTCPRCNSKVDTLHQENTQIYCMNDGCFETINSS